MGVTVPPDSQFLRRCLSFGMLGVGGAGREEFEKAPVSLKLPHFFSL